jgi:hypothetical protein
LSKPYRNPRGSHSRQFWETAYDNTTRYQFYYNKLTEIATSLFTWENLPPSVDPRFLELCLFSTGCAVFFKDDVLSEAARIEGKEDYDKHGYLALRVMANGPFDVYNTPINRVAYASSVGKNQWKLDNTNSVLIWNNRLRLPSAYEAWVYAHRLENIDRDVDVNAAAQKTPVIVTCPESQRLTFKNLMMQYDGNVPIIFGDKDLNLNNIQVLNPGVPYTAAELQDLKREIWNEALAMQGVPNLTISKRERLVTDEIQQATAGTSACRMSKLEARQQAAEQINKMFGLNIKVSVNSLYTSGISDDEGNTINDWLDPSTNSGGGESKE